MEDKSTPSLGKGMAWKRTSVVQLLSRKRKRSECTIPPVAFTQMFRYSNALDQVLMAVGLLAAIIGGMAWPTLVLVLGKVLDSFVAYAACVEKTNNNCTESAFKHLYHNATNATPIEYIDIEDTMRYYALYYCTLGCVIFVCGFIQVHTWVITSRRQSRRIRQLFFKAITRQEMDWFDSHPLGELNSRINEDVNRISDAIGEKMTFVVQKLSTVIAGFAIGFVYGWKLTLVIMAVSPLIGCVAAIMGKFLSSWSAKELQAYAKAGALAENVLLSIRTVAAYGGEEYEVERYNKYLGDAEKQGVRKGVSYGIFRGFLLCTVLLSYALAFWYGSSLVFDQEENYTVGNLLTIFFAVMLSALNLGQASSGFEIFTVGKGAAGYVFAVIERKSKIDWTDTSGIIPDEVRGVINFKNVNFQYTSRRRKKVLDSISLEFKTGLMTALVGPSGTGKSTILRLIQRLYDPNDGIITLDDRDIKLLNLRWLRSIIGVVNQDPILFATTIAENIRFGKDDVTDDEVIEAARAANAYDFIMELPKKFETTVGVAGCQMSGGQKQRISIARALIRKPKILLLDQACAALDTESEAVVLQKLHKIRPNCTVILVAHRFATIKATDKIIVIDNCKAIEEGAEEVKANKTTVYCNANDPKEIHQLREKSVYDNAAFMPDKENNEVFLNTLTKQRKFKLPPNTHRYFETNEECNQCTVTIPEVNTISQGSTSVSSESYDNCAEEELSKHGEDDVEPAPFSRILQLNATEYPYIVLGTVAAMVHGLIHPMLAFLLSNILGMFGTLSDENVRAGINLLCGMLAVIGVVDLISTVVEHSMFAKSGAILTKRVRKMAFASMLRQNVMWFDNVHNNTGALCTRLAVDASRIQGAAGVQVGIIVSSLTTITSAVMIAFYFGWKLAFVVISFFPFVIASHIIQIKIVMKGAQRDKTSIEKAGSVVTETLGAMTTVAAFGKEEYFCNEFQTVLIQSDRHARTIAIVQGLAFGIANAISFFSNAAAFQFGGYLVANGEMNFEDVFRVMLVIVFAGVSLGRSSHITPDYAKARRSATRIFQLLDRNPPIDSYSEGGQIWDDFQGNIEFRNCKFTYPTRINRPVLDGLDIYVDSGKTLALVGHSGCGKTTTVQLLERFFDPDSGGVFVDGRNVRCVNLAFLRSKIGMVFQEPILFAGTVYDNIVYGSDTRFIKKEDVERAAKIANIHDFISNLEKGYDTDVGNCGSFFSRGEKQRITIARALVRNPRILLLDEATSALDTENEVIVQEAMDRARQGRTSIVIAHRLSTVQNADTIAVMSQGRIVERGTHGELMSFNGAYCKLVTTKAKLS